MLVSYVPKSFGFVSHIHLRRSCPTFQKNKRLIELLFITFKANQSHFLPHFFTDLRLSVGAGDIRLTSPACDKLPCSAVFASLQFLSSSYGEAATAAASTLTSLFILSSTCSHFFLLLLCLLL